MTGRRAPRHLPSLSKLPLSGTTGRKVLRFLNLLRPRRHNNLLKGGMIGKSRRPRHLNLSKLPNPPYPNRLRAGTIGNSRPRLPSPPRLPSLLLLNSLKDGMTGNSRPRLPSQF
ncbi:uncharacterized protein A1O9_11348 [Exophiala aquamarina CBS 119918]|uniref:Uncharacterized protein n=1 Tax=Exophiala aquamarina CBS 119918 TaxID=1182545 RepID=A0A072NY06_9EURO|nr:uncharacterized protein A1O9_11348 [Exophiala aquamarina CBS 119918]KEF52506.1 hypothetical protein A1O9_11348 [Exophiala aquamarina CBS 119918]